MRAPWTRPASAAAAALLLAWLLAGCASYATCRSFDQCAAYTQAGITAARATAADLLARQQITVAQAERVQREADAARAHLTAARTLYGQGRPEDAQSALALAATILAQIERALEAAQR